jgi:hypothetical protein
MAFDRFVSFHLAINTHKAVTSNILGYLRLSNVPYVSVSHDHLQKISDLSRPTYPPIFCFLISR